MGVVNIDDTRITESALKTLFDEVYKAEAQKLVEQLCTVVESKSKIESYDFLGAMGLPREWTGDRRFEDFKAYPFSIENKRWEKSVSIDKLDWISDNYGKFKMQINNLASLWAIQQEKVVSDLIANGETLLCYDGKPFFADDHPAGDTVNDNLITGSDSHGVDTLAHIQQDYDTARTKLYTMKDDKGNPIPSRPTHIMIAPGGHIALFEQMLHAQLLSTGGTNIYYKSAELIINPYLTDAGEWYVLDLSKRLKPTIFQVLESPMDNFAIEGYFNSKMIKDVYFLTDAIYNAGFGDYKCAVKIDN